MSSTVTSPQKKADASRPAGGRLFLIDASAYIHRAYHALPPLKNSTGEPVGALYGFIRMLLGLIRREKPEYLAVCFDAPGPTLRHQAYAEYKATRKETDGDLKSQLKLARPLIEAMGLASYELPGYEADDLMATLAELCPEKGGEAVLVTTDKDAMQLVRAGVRILHEGKYEFFNEEKVVEKYGVRPDQIVDYLTILGDASDNVKGVAGIGAVGAAKLLQKFGTLAKAIEAAKAGDPAVAPKAAQALRDGEEQALASRKLIVLDRKAPIDCSIDKLRLKEFEAEKLIPLLKRFEFHSLIKDIFPDRSGAAAPVPEPIKVRPAIGISAFLKTAAKTDRVAVGLCRMPQSELFAAQGADCSIALALPNGQAAWFECADIEANRQALTKLFDSKIEKVGHELKPVFTHLRRFGVSVSGPVFDTMLASFCVNPGNGSYKFEGVEGEDARTTALRCLAGIWAETDRLKAALKEAGLVELYDGLEQPLTNILSKMEAEGVLVDKGYLLELQKEFEKKIEELKKEIDVLAGRSININSPKQLAQLLFEELRLPVIHKTPKGDPSTGEETLRALMDQHPVPARIIDFREVSKLKSTYVDGLLARIDAGTGRVHTTFNQAGAATGRLSSIDPNLQNIPIRSPMGQRIRRAFIARPGWVLLSADYSQIDLRVLAHLSEDPALVKAFRENKDIHLLTASEVFGIKPDQIDPEMRRRAKAVNFGIVYGQTPHGLSQELKIPFAQAKEYITKYFERYAGVAAWSKKTLDEARANQHVRTMLGRRRLLPDIMAKNTAVRQFTERVAVNTPIQGTSADIIKQAMVNIDRKLGKWKAIPLLQVHDELVFECPAAEAEKFGPWAAREMENAVKLKVPLVVDVKIGPNWQDMKKSARKP